MPNKSVVLHHPLPITANGHSASQIRPYKMRQAFQDLGYQIFEVTGYSHERKTAIAKIKQETKKGLKIDFLYSEFSTSPLATNDPNNLPLHPFMDFNFFRWFQRHHGKVGVFYRDVHWAFPFYKNSLSFLKRQVALALYHYDLQQLKGVDRIFVPSDAMIQYLPQSLVKSRPHVSPPGTNDTVLVGQENQTSLLYAGGLGGPIYQIGEFLNSIRKCPDLNVNLIVRKQEWEQFVKNTNFVKTQNINLIFADSSQSASHFQTSGFFALMIEPNEYFNMAMPMKLFDAISFELPIFCRRGSETAAFVETHGIGWVVDSTDQIIQLVNGSAFNEERKRCQENLKLAKAKHSWKRRAQSIADQLSLGL